MIWINKISKAWERIKRGVSKDPFSYGILVTALVSAIVVQKPAEKKYNEEKLRLEKEYKEKKLLSKEWISDVVREYIDEISTEYWVEISEEKKNMIMQILWDFLSNKKNQETLFNLFKEELKKRALEAPIAAAFFTLAIMYATAYLVLGRSAILKNPVNRVTFWIFWYSNIWNFLELMEQSEAINFLDKIATTPASWIYGGAWFWAVFVTLIDVYNSFTTKFSLEISDDGKILKWDKKLEKFTWKTKEEINEILATDKNLTINDILFSWVELVKANKHLENISKNTVKDAKELIIEGANWEIFQRISFDVWQYKDWTKRYDWTIKNTIKKEDHIVEESNEEKTWEIIAETERELLRTELSSLVLSARNTETPTSVYKMEGEPIFWNEALEAQTWYLLQEVVEYYYKHWEINSLLYKWEELKKVQRYLKLLEETWGRYEKVAFTMTCKNWEEKTFLWTTEATSTNKFTYRVAKILKDTEKEKAIKNTDKIIQRLARENKKLMNENQTLKDVTLTDNLTWSGTPLRLNRDFDYIKNHPELFKKTNTTFAFLDIDNFKIINDKLGHNIWDEILKIFADIFINETFTEDKLYRLSWEKDNVHGDKEMYRYGWDEFILIYKDVQNLEWLISKIWKLKDGFVTKSLKLLWDNNFDKETINYMKWVLWVTIWLKNIDFNNVPENASAVKEDIDDMMYAWKYLHLIDWEKLNLLIEKWQISENNTFFDKNRKLNWKNSVISKSANEKYLLEIDNWREKIYLTKEDYNYICEKRVKSNSVWVR